MRMKLACATLFVGACTLLYYGSGMLLLVPGDPGENYLKSVFSWRFVPGVVPIVASAVLLAAVGWLWDRSRGSADPVTVIGKTFVYADGTIALLRLGLMIIGGILQG
jgi:hypothetical protein